MVPTPTDYPWIIVIVTLAAATQAATGYGFALVLAPALQLVGTSLNGVRLVNVLSFVVNLCLLMPLRHEVDLRKATSLSLPAILLAPLGAWLALHINSYALGIAVGLIVLVTAVFLAFGFRLPTLSSRTGALIAGGASGVMSLLSGVGGPAIMLYVMNANWPRKIVIPTLQVYFLSVNVVAIFLLGLPSISPAWLLLLAVAVTFGLWLGIRIRKLISDTRFGHVVLALAALGGCASAVKSLVYFLR
jgi:uncharacterized membrane protein YfcA